MRIIGLLLLLVLPLLAPQKAYQMSADDYCITPFAQELLTLINDYRAQNGKGPLVITKTLGAAAQHHSDDMAENDYFAHTLSDGTTWSKNMTNHGYTYTTYRGENLAGNSANAQGVFIQWKNSYGHNANLLNKNYKAIGIGQAHNADARYDWYTTATFGGIVDTKASLC
jgi:uncharacterized protein YkwD